MAFKPTTNLPVGSYTMALSAVGTDVAGNALTSPLSVAFTTGAVADTTPPSVTGAAKKTNSLFAVAACRQL